MKKYLLLFWLTCVLWFFNMCVSASITQIEAPWAVYNDVQMGWIKFDNGNGNVVMILDRNLGASSAWTWSDSYGDYFQRGNNYWFDSNPENIDRSQIDVSDYWPDNYYYSRVFIIWNWGWAKWDTDVIKNLWWWLWDDESDTLGLTAENVKKRQGPCPDGYHIPSAWERNNLLYLWWNVYSGDYVDYTYSTIWSGISIINAEATVDFRDSFLIPSQWYLNALFRDLQFMRQKDFNKSAYLWTSSSYTHLFSWSLLLSWSNSIEANYKWTHSNGYPIRCFYDSYLEDQIVTLSFETDWWTAIETQRILLNWIWTKPENPSKIGYTFAWWYAQSDFSSDEFDFQTPIIWDTTLYAKRDINQYSITFYSDDESIMGTITYDYNADIDVSTIDTSREWYSFSGWNPFVPAVMPAENLVVTGERVINQYTITFNTNGWTAIESIIQDYWTVVNKPSDPIRAWYTFAWWDRDIPSTMPAENIIISANWQKVSWWWGGGWWWGGWGSSKVTTTTWSSIQTGVNVSTWLVITWNIATWTDYMNSSEDTTVSTKYTINFTWYEWWDQNEILSDWYSREFHNAYAFAYNNKITTIDTIKAASMYSPLTRIAMAKMLSYYAINILNQNPDTSKSMNFSDISTELDSQYDNGITLAYQLWIMWINMPNNKFRPYDQVTRAEFATALSRMIFWIADWNPYYSTHLMKLKQEWIITNDNPKLKELRWYVMVMLMRSAQ